MTKVHELSAKLSSKGQVVIPSDVRKHLGLSQGSVVRFRMEANGVRLLAQTGDVQRLKGRLAAPDGPVSIDDMNRSIAERRSRIGGSKG